MGFGVAARPQGCEGWLADRGSVVTDLLEIETVPTLGSAELIAALSRQGVRCSVSSDHAAIHDSGGASLMVRVEGDAADLVGRVVRALDYAIAGCGLPLMTQRVGKSSFVVRPPAG